LRATRLETKTILPVIEAFQAQHRLSKVTVVADAAMLSSSNLEALTAAGYTYYRWLSAVQDTL